MAYSFFKTISVITYCFFSLVYAGADEEFFLQANAQYQAGKFESALKLYEAVANKGAAVWYNMGLSSYHLNDIPHALLYLRRALSQSSRFNYWTIKNHLLQLDPHQLSSLDKLSMYTEYSSTAISYAWLQCIILLFWSAFCISLYFFRSKKRIIISIMIGCLLLGAFVLLRKQFHLRFDKIAVVKKADTPVYLGPNSAFNQTGLLQERAIVTVLQEGDNWYKVRYNKVYGWIEADNLVI